MLRTNLARQFQALQGAAKLTPTYLNRSMFDPQLAVCHSVSTLDLRHARVEFPEDVETLERLLAEKDATL